MPLTATALATALRIASVAILTVAAVGDVRRRVIPDLLTLVVFAAGIALRLSSHAAGFWVSALAGAAVYVALAVLVHANVIGGADAKLTAAVSFLVPAVKVPGLLVDIALAGGALSLLYLLARQLRPRINATLPYGVAIVAGSTYRIMADLCSCSDATSFWR